MTDRFKQISEWVAKAADAFMAQNSDSILMGLIDKQLREQGLQADAISIEIVKRNIKILILVPDNINHSIEGLVGNKEGDEYSSFKEPFDALSEERFLDILNFQLSPQRAYSN